MGVRRIICSVAVLGTGRSPVPSATTVAEDADPELPEIDPDEDVPPELEPAVQAGTLSTFPEMSDMVDTPECHERCPQMFIASSHMPAESRTAFKNWCLTQERHWCMESCGQSDWEISCGNVIEL